MTQEYNIEQQWHHTLGDRRTAIAATLRDADRAPVDLTGHTVAFRLTRASDDTVKINSAAATVDSALLGQVSYALSAADHTAIATAGDHWAWFIVTRTSDSKVDHYPPEGKRWRVTMHTAY